MPNHDALVPPPAARPSGSPTRAGGWSVQPTTDVEKDLAAVPTFLRDRHRDRDGAGDGDGARPARRRRIHPEPASDTTAVTAAAVAALPMAGLPPRRIVVLGIAIVLVWMVASFGRQVTEASAATARADQLRAAAAALAVEVAGLEEELQTVQGPRYIAGAARAYRLGTSREIAFALEVGAPPLGPDAPGSGSHRLGSETSSVSPLRSWLAVLFGPGD